MGKTGATTPRIDLSHASSLVSVAALAVVVGFGSSATAWTLFAVVVLGASVTSRCQRRRTPLVQSSERTPPAPSPLTVSWLTSWCS
jgi:hypothetical protein